MKIKLIAKTLLVEKTGHVRYIPGNNAYQNFDPEEINRKFVITSYKNLMNIIRDIDADRKDRTLVVSVQKGWFFLIEKKTERSYELIVAYKLEGEVVENRLKKIFAITEEEKGKIIILDENNNYTFVCNADILQVILADAELIINNEESFFTWEKYFPAKKKTRKLYAPHEDIKPYLSNLDKVFQKYFANVNKNFQVAYRKHKSVINAAELHKDHKYVFCIDLHHFFESCDEKLVKEKIHFLFKNALNKSVLEKLFINIITDNGGLFLGNPISGSIANSIIANPVKYINNMCKKVGIAYSVYADDMIFSSDKPFAKQFVLDLFNKAFEKYGLENYFKLNDDKTHGMVGDQRTVLGIRLNNNNQLACKKKMFELIRVQIHKLSLGIDDPRTNIQQLRGRIAWCLNIDTTGKVIRYLNKFSDTVRKFKLVSDSKLEEIGIL